MTSKQEILLSATPRTCFLAVVGYRSFFYRVLVDSFTVFAYSYMRQLELIRLNACAAAI